MSTLFVVLIVLAALIVVAMAVGKVSGRDGILGLCVLAVVWLLFAR